MKILSLEYENKSSGWKLEKTEFDRLTLLVGASGVGKTMILRAIQSLIDIAEGKSLNGVSWRLEFCSNDGIQYVWSGEFRDIDTMYPRPNLANEKIYQGDAEIVERSLETTQFNREVTSVKLAADRSVLYLLTGEKVIADITKSLRSIRLSDFSPDTALTALRIPESVDSNLSSYTSYEQLIESRDLGIRNKLLRLGQIDWQRSEQIEEEFKAVFPFVTSARPIEHSSSGNGKVVEIMIHDVGMKPDPHLTEQKIASGMLRTYLQIAELYLSPRGTVFLIDEFENSLGINCLDEVTDAILGQDRDYQFIMTSHHPYIINNIDLKHWRIVTRDGGIVSTHRASDFNLGHSKHEAFTQLINLDAYVEGVTA